MVINVIIEDNSAEEVDQAELADWADEYGLTMPVLSDPGGAFMYSHVTGSTVGLPYVVLLDRGAVIDQLGWATIDEAADLAARGN